MATGLNEKHFELIPSIASANPLQLGAEITRLGNHPYLHIDIEDGNFVPNITFGMKVVQKIAALYKQELDVHLMVTNPMLYIDSLREYGVRKIAIHFESYAYPIEVLQKIKDSGMQAGLALNFKTSCDDVRPYLPFADYILVMTAEPDGREQQFYALICEKINQLKAYMTNEQEVWVDGGIGERELELVAIAGADKAIMGRFIFASDEPEQLMFRLQQHITRQRNRTNNGEEEIIYE